MSTACHGQCWWLVRESDIRQILGWYVDKWPLMMRNLRVRVEYDSFWAVYLWLSNRVRTEIAFSRHLYCHWGWSVDRLSVRNVITSKKWHLCVSVRRVTVRVDVNVHCCVRWKGPVIESGPWPVELNPLITSRWKGAFIIQYYHMVRLNLIVLPRGRPTSINRTRCWLASKKLSWKIELR